MWLLGGVLAGLFGVSATVLTAWVSIAGGVALFLSAFVGLIVAEAIHFNNGLRISLKDYGYCHSIQAV